MVIMKTKGQKDIDSIRQVQFKVKGGKNKASLVLKLYTGPRSFHKIDFTGSRIESRRVRNMGLTRIEFLTK